MISSNFTFHQELSEIIEELNRQTENEFIHRYADIPPIPHLRLQVLYLFLLDAGVEQDEIKSYLVSTLLVQIALDCHERVTLHRVQSEQGIRTRQLTVLAGDFFSSKYYYLLSKLGNVKLIRELARAIYYINEKKTELYINQTPSSDAYLQARKAIDGALYVSFVPLYDVQQSLWKYLMDRFILAERLLDELLTYQWDHSLNGYMRLLAGQATVEDAYGQVQLKLELCLEEIKQDLDKLQNQKIAEELSQMASRISHQIANYTNV